MVFNYFRGSCFTNPIALHRIRISKISNKVEFIGAIPNLELQCEHISVAKFVLILIVN